MKKTPMQKVAEIHGDKDKLVEKILGLIDRVASRGDESREDHKKRLLSASNAKLVRLERTLAAIDKQFGSRDKLADAYVALVGRAKDADYRQALGAYPPGRLLDLYTAAERRSRRKKAA
jgi:hypothetical protein